MSRQPSAAMMKGNTRRVLNPEPKEGSYTREVYDLFLSHKGRVFSPQSSTKFLIRVGYLRDFYGLDIRCLGQKRWLLAGEWHNDKYEDYVAALGGYVEETSKSV
jgi:hypothetical protein